MSGGSCSYGAHEPLYGVRISGLPKRDIQVDKVVTRLKWNEDDTRWCNVPDPCRYQCDPKPVGDELQQGGLVDDLTHDVWLGADLPELAPKRLVQDRPRVLWIPDDRLFGEFDEVNVGLKK